jgi:hypothetical protein
MTALISEKKGLYSLVELKLFRKTPGVVFDLYPLETLPHIDAIDRVLHEKSAVSPGPIGEVERPWYMHTHQADNLIVLYGQRTVELFSKSHGKIETFVVTPDKIYHDDQLLFDGGAVLGWPPLVFHRIVSGEQGSASINLAVHSDGFDIRTNFNIYDLNVATGSFKTIRKGAEDQF